MSDEPRGALEGLASALVSSDLTVKKEGKRGDVDYLIALGAVGIRLRPAVLSVDDVAIMMTGLKLAGLANDVEHRDSQVDACGYLALLERIQGSNAEITGG